MRSVDLEKKINVKKEINKLTIKVTIFTAVVFFY